MKNSKILFFVAFALFAFISLLPSAHAALSDNLSAYFTYDNGTWLNSSVNGYIGIDNNSLFNASGKMSGEF